MFLKTLNMEIMPTARICFILPHQCMFLMAHPQPFIPIQYAALTMPECASYISGIYRCLAAYPCIRSTSGRQWDC